MKKILSFILAVGIISGIQNAYADSRIGLCTDLGDTTINVEKTLNTVVKTDAEWIRFSSSAWRDCLQEDGSFVYPETEKELLMKIGEQGIKKISILGMGTPSNKYFRTEEDKNKEIYAKWYDLPVYVDGDSYAIEYWNANLEAVENIVKSQLGLIDAYEIWNEPNHWGFNGYTKKCKVCGTEYEDYSMPSKCICGGALEGEVQTSGKEYAEVYIAWREIVDKVYCDAGLEPVPVYCGSVTGWNDGDKAFFDECVSAIIEHDGDLSELDGITLHLYGKAESVWGMSAFVGYKKALSNTGFCGEIFMTETGLPTVGYSDKEQAIDMIPRKVFYDTFVKNMNLSGLSTKGQLLYYELADRGNNPDESEDNYGIIDFMYDNKEAAETLRVLNKVLKGKELVGFSHEDDEDVIDYSANTKEIRVAQYEGNGDTAYLIFRHSDSDIFDYNTSVMLDVSGDEVRTYNYLGGLKELIDKNPAKTKTFMGIKVNNPTIVECITYKSVIEWARYDEDSAILSFEGNFWDEESFESTICTAEIVNIAGEVVASTTVNVKNDRFSDWISLDVPNGEYTLRVGKPEVSTNADEVSFTVGSNNIMNVPKIVGMTAIYESDKNIVKISGAVEDASENQKITVLVVPSGVDLEKLNPDAIGCIKEIKLGDEGKFADELKIPEWYSGAAKLYVSGSGIKDVKSTDFIKKESEFAHIAEFSGTDDITVSAKVSLKNFTSKEQKAVILICEYGKKGELVNSHIENITIPAKTYTLTSYTLNDVVPDKNTTQIRAYLWSDLKGIKPLAEAINIRN